METIGNFRSTAMQCRRFQPTTGNAFTNVAGESVSCLNCSNFKNNHCTYDLYDKINNPK